MGAEHEEAGHDVAAASRSQPEFDFDDEEEPAIAVGGLSLAAQANQPNDDAVVIDQAPMAQMIESRETPMPAAPVEAVVIPAPQVVARIEPAPVAAVPVEDTAAVVEPFTLEPTPPVDDTAAVGMTETPTIAEADSVPDTYSTPPGLFDIAPSAAPIEPAQTPDPEEAAVQAVAEQSDAAAENDRQDRQNA
jgi:ribonuclease E